MRTISAVKTKHGRTTATEKRRIVIEGIERDKRLRETAIRNKEAKHDRQGSSGNTQTTT